MINIICDHFKTIMTRLTRRAYDIDSQDLRILYFIDQLLYLLDSYSIYFTLFYVLHLKMKPYLYPPYLNCELNFFFICDPEAAIDFTNNYSQT